MLSNGSQEKPDYQVQEHADDKIKSFGSMGADVSRLVFFHQPNHNYDNHVEDRDDKKQYESSNMHATSPVVLIGNF